MSDLPGHTTIAAILAEQGMRFATRSAILGVDRPPLTYGGLSAHVDDIATTLNSYGIGRNDRVAIVVPNGPEMLTAFLAVAACATSAPLNPTYRAAEYEFYLSDLDARALIISAGTDSPARDVGTRLGIAVIELAPRTDEPAGIFELHGSGSPTTNGGFAAADDVALVLHTSGTTSRPKMVPLTHRNICASAANISATLALTPADRCLNVMPLFHIHGLMGASMSSLSAGAELVCTPGFDRSCFFRWLAEFTPTWYSAVPTMHQAIVSEAAEHPDVVAAARLRFIRSSSSSLPPVVMSELEALFDAPVIESYGMTEAAHQMTSNPLPPAPRKPGSVGPAAGPRVAIMDNEGALLSQGEIGEIVIQGPNVTSGYVTNPEANAGAFTNGWFRTGDQGRIDTDGYVAITGRLKEIINRGGEKVAPREVDEALLDHPSVLQATAFAAPHPTLGEDVVAAVVLDPKGPTVTEKELRDLAFASLADFKVPSQIVFVDEVPKGATGKLQRIGLADKLRNQLQIPYVEPRTALEHELALLWVRTLRIDRVGAHDNFFSLGGDSLTAAKLFVEIEHRLDKRLPLAALFQAPTVEQLAAVIDNEAWTPDWSPLVPIQPEGTGRPFYFVHAHGGNVVGYHDLATRMGDDQPFFGLQARGLDGSAIAPRSIEEMAADYVDQIRAYQPVGPYAVGGWCMGGVIAFEMAQQLIAGGHTVAIVAMVQASHPHHARARDARLRTRLQHGAQRIGAEIGAARETAPHSRIGHMRSRAGNAIAALTTTLDKRLRSPLGRVRIELPESRGYLLDAVEAAHNAAAERYEPKPYGGAVVIVRAAKQPRGAREDRFLGWGPVLTGQVTTYDIPGYQLGMISEPRAQLVAAHLSRHLKEPT